MANTINNYIIQQKLKDGMITLHPQTNAAMVTYDSNIQGTAGTVQFEIFNLKDQISDWEGEVVTKIKPSNSAVPVQLPDDIGLITLTHENMDTYSRTHIDDISTTIEAVRALAQEAKTLASQGTVSRSYASYDDMINAVTSATKDYFKVGDKLLIKDTGVSDYWISEVFTTNSGTYGYYNISKLESNTDFLVNYQTVVDPALDSVFGENPSIVHAINLLKAKLWGLLNTTAVSSYPAYSAIAFALSAAHSDIATTATKATGADKLNYAREIKITGDTAGKTTFDGTTDVTITTELKASGVAEGTYSAVTVTPKGIVTAGAQVIEIGITGQVSPQNLATGGLFFEKVG